MTDSTWVKALFCTTLVLLLLSTGCSEAPKTPEQDRWFGVDPLFREFWGYLGGVEVLGKAVAPAQTEGEMTTQFLETCKLIYDPQASANRRFTLAPLGSEMGLGEPPVPPPAQSDLRYIDGHIIFPDFWPLYERLGAAIVGRPLTEVRYNLIRRRYEQYFENLGLYRLEGSSEVHLLTYGLWACGTQCQYVEQSNSATIDISHYIDPAFQEFVNQMGADFTGYALTEAYSIEDGRREQILENVVLVGGSAGDPANVRLQPVSTEVGILIESPRPYSGNPNSYFYATQGEMGYEIPLFFWEYILRHGGIEMWGPPISHYAPLDGMSYHQCFTNLCLAYDLRANEQARIRPEPLGYAYKVLYYKPSIQTPSSQSAVVPTITPTPLQREIVVFIWARFPVVNSSQSQEIGINIYEGNSPLADLQPDLTLIFLDNVQLSFSMPPSDSNGQSVLSIPPIQASNGTVVIYKICVQPSDSPRLCVKDSFMIWNNP